MNEGNATSEFREFTSLILGLFAVAPSIAKALSTWLIGPFPTVAFVTVSGFVSLAAIMIAFVLYRRSRISKKAIHRNIKFWLGASAVFGIAYLILGTFLIVKNPDWAHRDVVGFVMHDDKKQLVDSDPSFYTPENLLARSGRDVNRVWTPASVGLASIVMTMAWYFTTVPLLISFAAFVAGEQMEAAKKKSPKSAKVPPVSM